MRAGLKRRDLFLVAGAGVIGAVSPARAVEADSPLAVARRLAAVYPVKPSLGYVSALILSAQRRLHADGQLPSASQAVVQAWRDCARARPLPADWPQRAGFAVFAEAARADGDAEAGDLARQAVHSAVVDGPGGLRLNGLRPWTDDLFMATLLVDRCMPLLSPPEQGRVAEALAGTLAEGVALLQRADGLFDHAVGSPVARRLGPWQWLRIAGAGLGLGRSAAGGANAPRRAAAWALAGASGCAAVTAERERAVASGAR